MPGAGDSVHLGDGGFSLSPLRTPDHDVDVREDRGRALP